MSTHGTRFQAWLMRRRRLCIPRKALANCLQLVHCGIQGDSKRETDKEARSLWDRGNTRGCCCSSGGEWFGQWGSHHEKVDSTRRYRWESRSRRCDIKEDVAWREERRESQKESIICEVCSQTSCMWSSIKYFTTEILCHLRTRYIMTIQRVYRCPPNLWVRDHIYPPPAL